MCVATLPDSGHSCFIARYDSAGALHGVTQFAPGGCFAAVGGEGLFVSTATADGVNLRRYSLTGTLDWSSLRGDARASRDGQRWNHALG